MEIKLNPEIERFESERVDRIEALVRDTGFEQLSTAWLETAMEKSYAYNFEWLGRPIIQLPQDIVATQELIWAVRPDLIIETGIAHGGSLILSASILALIEIADASKNHQTIDPNLPKSRVLGIDIDIRTHNRKLIEEHGLSPRIEMIEGSSVDPEVIRKVEALASQNKHIMIFLDSNHTHEHVLQELNLYSQFVSGGSYLVVFDTFVEKMTKDIFPNRPWTKGDNPMTATREFLASNKGFEADKGMAAKLGITVAPDGFLRKIAD
nr:cephalosporin hydroxylase family protein [Candidatus Planktophila versatilis]